MSRSERDKGKGKPFAAQSVVKSLISNSYAEERRGKRSIARRAIKESRATRLNAAKVTGTPRIRGEAEKGEEKKEEEEEGEEQVEENARSCAATEQRVSRMVSSECNV